MTCTLSFADESSFAATSSGTGVVVVKEPIAFTADEPFNRVCQTVDFHDDGEPPRTRCPEHTHEQHPRQEVLDLVDGVFATVPGSKDAVCAAIQTVEPYLPDVWNTLMVNDEGELFVGYLFWFCWP